MPSNSALEASRYVTAASSVLLRLATFVFLRWIPGGGLPSIIYTLAALYFPSFVYAASRTAPYKVVSETIEVKTREVPSAEAAAAVDPQYANLTRASNEPVQELVVEDDIELAVKDPHILMTLLTGLPSPSNTLLNIVTFGINLAMLTMTLDLVYRNTLFYPSHDLSMARVGYVSDTTASILVREPDAHKLPVAVSYRYADEPYPSGVIMSPDASWKVAGRLDWMDNRTDFTDSLTITGLRSDTRYQFAASNNHTGFFTTAPRVGQISTRPGANNLFTFVHSSCLKLNFPYNPLRHSLSAPGLQHLSNVLRTLSAQFMLFLGDFIYIDVPQQHGTTLEDYRREYRQVYSSPDWPSVTRELPWIHVYDDHEVRNDWDGNTTHPFLAAYDAYSHYHTSINPPLVRKDASYFAFTQGPATFFMLDTRRYRTPNDATNGSDPITGVPTKSMLGPEQLRDLLAWLRRPEPPGVRWKILISSVPFTMNWRHGAQDTWRGYLGERQLILEAMWDVSLQQPSGVGVIILSGDRHEFAATAFPPPPDGIDEIIGLGSVGGIYTAGAASPSPSASPAAFEPLHSSLATHKKHWPLSATVHEFSASPLSMFYLPVRTYAQSSTSPHYVSDVCIKYLPDGNSKFGAVQIENHAASEQSLLTYRLFVEGQEAWRYTLTTPMGTAKEGLNGRIREAVWG